MNSKPIYAWHFSDGYLRFDYEGTKVETGLVLETGDEPVPEKNGFHACVNAIDALRWFAVRPSSNVVISRVRLGGKIIKDNSPVTQFKGTRHVAQRRDHLWVADARDTLVQFTDYFLAEYWRLHSFYDAKLTVEKLDIDGCISYWNDEIQIHSAPSMKAMQIRDPQFLALEVTNTATQTANAVYNRLAWQEAKANHFKISEDTEYFLRDYYGWIDYDVIDNEYAMIYFIYPDKEAILPPYSYRSYGEIDFSSPDAKLHNMLMQLAPEGYTEP